MTMKNKTVQPRLGHISSARKAFLAAALGFQVLTSSIGTNPDRFLGTATAAAKTDAGAPKDKAQAPRNEKDQLNRDLLEAVGNGDKLAVEKLLGQGADPNAKDGNGKSLLALAVIDDHNEIARALLKKGADVNAADAKGKTPLMEAVIEGHLGAVRLLLDNGAAVDAVDNNKMTALSHANQNGRGEIAKALEAKGAKA